METLKNMTVKKIKKGNLNIEFIIHDYKKTARITPNGFYTDVVQVYHYPNILTHKFKETEIKWCAEWGVSEGGGVERVANFIEALNEAIYIREEWMKGEK